MKGAGERFTERVVRARTRQGRRAARRRRRLELHLALCRRTLDERLSARAAF